MGSVAQIGENSWCFRQHFIVIVSPKIRGGWQHRGDGSVRLYLCKGWESWKSLSVFLTVMLLDYGFIILQDDRIVVEYRGRISIENCLLEQNFLLDRSWPLTRLQTWQIQLSCLAVDVKSLDLCVLVTVLVQVL